MTAGSVCDITGCMKFADHLNRPFKFEGKEILLKSAEDAETLADLTDRLCAFDLYGLKEKSVEIRKRLDEFIEGHEINKQSNK